MDSPATTRIRIWDGPVRVFHWSIVLILPALWWTAEHDQMEWHKRLGYVALGLIVFRLLWGVFGSSTARFSSFVRGPAKVWRYARSLTTRELGEATIGHNPMGGLSVVALLLLLTGEVVLGLFCVDVDGLESGPLADRISFDGGRIAAHWHALLFNGLLGLIGLHLLAIAFYFVARRENLVGPMITGARRLRMPAASAAFASGWKLALAAVIAGSVALLASRGLHL